MRTLLETLRANTAPRKHFGDRVVPLRHFGAKRRENLFGGILGWGVCTGTPPPCPTTTRDSDPAQISPLSTLHTPRTHRSLVIRTHDTHLWEKLRRGRIVANGNKDQIINIKS